MENGLSLKFIADAEGFVSAIKKIDRSLVVLQSQLRANKNEFDKEGNVVENLTQRNDLLGQKIELLGSKIRTLCQALRLESVQQKENIKIKEKFQDQLARSTGKLVEARSEYQKNANKINDLTKRQRENNNVQKENVLMIESSKNKYQSFFDKLSSGFNKINDSFKNLGANFRTILINVKRFVQVMYGEFISKAISFSEELNLFNVVFDNITKNGKTVFSELGREATQFQNKMNEAFGTNKMETMRYQGLFQAMGESAGIKEELAAVMSENATKLAYDLASLYNTTETKAAESLRAGIYAGQTKPLRNYGLDVTQQSFMPILASLGIDKRASELSQGEKEILRYLAALKQAGNAMGDFANTIESPANQLKVLRQQFIEMKVAIGNLFVGAFSRILPYVNAIIMVIKELADAVASFFGIQIKDYNTRIASYGESLNEYSDDLDDVGSSASSTAKKMKELNRQTLGFDQINNIKSPTPNSGSGGSGGVSVRGGIDKRLLDAIKGYSNGMENVRMKAEEIRDKIMQWLGFTKEIDAKTGDISFKFDHITGGTVLGGLLAGGLIYKGVSGIFGFLSKIGLVKFTGLAALGTSLKTILSYWTSMGKEGLFYALGETAKGAATKIGIFGKAFAKIAPIVAVAVASLVAFVKGAKDVNSASKEIGKGTTELKYSVEELGKSLTLTIAGGAAIGTLIAPGIGTAIGAVVGLLGGLISAVAGYKKGIEELAYSNLFGTLSVSQQEWTDMINNSIPPLEGLSDNFEKLKSNLTNLAGDFEAHNEQLDLLALKYSITGQQISEKDGQAFLGAIQGIADSSKQIVQESGDFYLTSTAELFNKTNVLTEEEEKNILSKIVQSNEAKKKDIDDAQKKITSIYNTGIKKRGYLTDEEYSEIQRQLAKIKSLVDKEMTKNQTDYEYFKQAANDKNLKLDEQSYKDFNAALDNYLTDRKNKLAENYNIDYNANKKLLDDKAISQETYNAQMKQLNEQRKNDEENLYSEVEGLRKKVYSNLADEYVKVKDQNDAVSKQMKKDIEGIFKDINVDSKDIESEFASIGTKVGGVCRNNIISSMNSGNLKMKVIPTKSQQDELGLKKSYEIPMKITQKAKGGFLNTGELFIAREVGPELVGKIGNRTAVANNDQIVSAIRSGVYDAVSSALSNGGYGSVDIQLHTDEGVIVDRINRITRQTGTCPINI